LQFLAALIAAEEGEKSGGNVEGKKKLLIIFSSLLILIGFLFFFYLRSSEKEKASSKGREELSTISISKEGYIEEEKFGLLFPKSFGEKEIGRESSEKKNISSGKKTSSENLSFEMLSPSYFSQLDKPLLGRVVGKIVEVKPQAISIKVDFFRGFEESSKGKGKGKVLTLPQGTIIDVALPSSPMKKGKESVFQKGKTIIATLKFIPTKGKEEVIFLSYEVFGKTKKG
jgi:hypothetical protein